VHNAYPHNPTPFDAPFVIGNAMIVALIFAMFAKRRN
jgi:hypothetical protein